MTSSGGNGGEGTAPAQSGGSTSESGGEPSANTGGTPWSSGGLSSGGSVPAGGGSVAVEPTGGSGGGRPAEGSGGAAEGSGGAAEGSGGAAEGSGGSDGSGGAVASVDPNFHIFLLLGQSNMDGVPKPEAEDLVELERVRVLGFDDCSNIGRQEGEWYTARPPLHRCYGGVGPGDWFGKSMAKAHPEATIGLVPCALPSADIDAFRKGIVSARRSDYVLPPDNAFPDAYEWVLHRAQVAQKSGVIRGILLHQGESDTGKTDWADKVTEIAEDLRLDLALGDAPLLVGELVHGGCCDSHNPIIAKVPTLLEKSYVISAQGLTGLPEEPYHFDLAGQRTMGERFAQKMLEVWAP